MPLQTEFNRLADHPRKEIKALIASLPPEARAEANEIEAERRQKRSDAHKIQQQQRQDDINAERTKVAGEKATLRYIPKLLRSGKSKAEIEAQAVRNVEARNQAAIDKIDRDADARIRNIVEQERLRGQLKAEVNAAASPDQPEPVATLAQLEPTWTADDLETYNRLVAEHREAERQAKLDSGRDDDGR